MSTTAVFTFLKAIVSNPFPKPVRHESSIFFTFFVFFSFFATFKGRSVEVRAFSVSLEIFRYFCEIVTV